MICINWVKHMQITPLIQTTAMNLILCIKQIFLTSLFCCTYYFLNISIQYKDRGSFPKQSDVKSILPTHLVQSF